MTFNSAAEGTAATSLAGGIRAALEVLRDRRESDRCAAARLAALTGNQDRTPDPQPVGDALAYERWGQALDSAIRALERFRGEQEDDPALMPRGKQSKGLTRAIMMALGQISVRLANPLRKIEQMTPYTDVLAETPVPAADCNGRIDELRLQAAEVQRIHQLLNQLVAAQLVLFPLISADAVAAAE